MIRYIRLTYLLNLVYTLGTKMKKLIKAKNSPNQNTTKTSCGNVAEWYDDLLEKSPDSFQSKVILPNLLRIVDPKPGQKILDVACGQGYFSRAFHQNGAQVTGCDISKELVDIAIKNSPENILYFVAPANQMADKIGANDLADKFDVATIILAIQNIEDMRATFIECAKLLKDGGRLIFVINHPVFRIPQGSSWQWDDKSHQQYRRIDAYMTDTKIKIDMAPGESARNQNAYTRQMKANTLASISTTSFHRPLQSYFKALNSAGLSVTRLEEWISHKQSQAGPRASEEDRTRKEIPLFMCIEAKKI